MPCYFILSGFEERLHTCVGNHFANLLSRNILCFECNVCIDKIETNLYYKENNPYQILIIQNF